MADLSRDPREKKPSTATLLGESDLVRVLIFDEPDTPQAKPYITLNQLVDLLSLCIAKIFLLYVTGKWIAPFIITKVITPMLKREASMFPRPTLLLLLTTSLALSPIFLLPSGPSMYLSGLFFGYKTGFFIIIIGTTIGIIPPFIVGQKFPKSIKKLLTRWPDEIAYVRLSKGSCLHQFQMATFFRLSSLNYAVVNYCVGVSSMSLPAYICGSVCVMIPEAYLYLFSAKVMKVCAELKNYWSQNGSETVFFVVSVACALGVYVCFLVLESRAMKELEEIRKEEL